MVDAVTEICGSAGNGLAAWQRDALAEDDPAIYGGLVEDSESVLFDGDVHQPHTWLGFARSELSGMYVTTRP